MQQPPAARIATHRLTLREADVDDAYAFRDMMCETAFWTQLPIDPPSLSSIRAHLAQGRRDAAAEPRVAWSLAAVETATGRIVARCRLDNAASRRIMAKLGFREEGVAREDVFARGQWWDSLQAAILDHEWRAGAGREAECRRST